MAISLLTKFKSSLQLQIKIIFFLIFILINSIVLVLYVYDKNNQELFNLKRYISAKTILEHNYYNNIKIKNENLESFNLKVSSLEHKHFDKRDIIIRKKLFENEVPFMSENEQNFPKPFEIYILDGKKYIVFRLMNKDGYFNMKEGPLNKRFDENNGSPLPPSGMLGFPGPPGMMPFPNPTDGLKGNFETFEKFLVLEDTFKFNYLKYILFLILIDTLLIWFFVFLKNSLKPLGSLKKEIINFAQGNLNISTKQVGTNEISQVANEFDNAIVTIKKLNESRNLFLRNIMHELKTPITKGKLISDTLEEGKQKDILQRVFLRFEYLLDEFSKIEELSSNKLILNKKEYRVIDIIEQSLDILLIDKSKLDIYYSNKIIDVDFDFFSIAIKNLIDNALKYKTEGKPKLILGKNSLKIVNKGKPLNKDISQYYKPFNHDYETSLYSLGLGLYVTKNIILKHNFDLWYYYDNDEHTFEIVYYL